MVAQHTPSHPTAPVIARALEPELVGGTWSDVVVGVGVGLPPLVSSELGLLPWHNHQTHQSLGDP